MNVQYAIQRDVVYVLEVNPRASRTVPYVSKATGVPLAKVAARLMTGKKLREMKLAVNEFGGVAELRSKEYYCVKSPVFPFSKFRGVDTILGPEMRSTGEVMGVSPNFGLAFAKAQLAAGQKLPLSGTVFISVNDHDKRFLPAMAKDLATAGLNIIATRGTAAALRSLGIEAEPVYKVNEGRPNIVDLVKTGKVQLIINTPLGRESFYDEKSIRRAAVRYAMPCITTISAAVAAARGIRAMSEGAGNVAALQDLHAEASKPAPDGPAPDAKTQRVTSAD
jgi:carbamoyl-phosphate synthase large subunit